jgi:hypothetical protein
LVYVYDFQAAPAPVFDEVRDSVLDNWTVAQQEQFNEQYFESLKGRYDIVIEDVPSSSVLGAQAGAKGENQSGNAAVAESAVEPAS